MGRKCFLIMESGNVLMNKCYEADLYRYYGRKETFIEYITRTEVIKYIVLLRKTQGCKSIRFNG